MWKDDTANDTVVQTEVNQTFVIVMDHTTSMSSHSALAVGIVSSDLCIEITHDQKHIMLVNFGNCLL